MLDQNTDRMWFVIGAVIVGAAIIFIANGTMPELFASAAESFEDSVAKGEAVVDRMYHPYIAEDFVWLKTYDTSENMRGTHGSEITIEPDVTVPRWQTSNAYRLQTVGGSHRLKAYAFLLGHYNQTTGRDYVYYVPVWNQSDERVQVINNLGDSIWLDAGEERIVELRGKGSSVAHLQFHFYTEDSSGTVDAIVGDLILGYIAKDGE